MSDPVGGGYNERSFPQSVEIQKKKPPNHKATKVELVPLVNLRHSDAALRFSLIKMIKFYFQVYIYIRGLTDEG